MHTSTSDSLSIEQCLRQRIHMSAYSPFTSRKCMQKQHKITGTTSNIPVSVSVIRTAPITHSTTVLVTSLL